MSKDAAERYSEIDEGVFYSEEDDRVIVETEKGGRSMPVSQYEGQIPSVDGGRGTMTNGGVEFDFQQMEVYDNDISIDQVAQRAVKSENDVDVYKFGEEGVAIAGETGSVRQFMNDNRDIGDLHRNYRSDWHSEVPMPDKGEFSKYELEVAGDGGIVMERDPVSNYDVDDPTEQFWWDDVQGGNEIEEVREVFDSVDVDPEYGNSDRFIVSGRAFSKTEIEAILDRAEEQYGGTVGQFVEEVAVSKVHPQHAKQIERAFENDVRIPNSFDEYDGFPTAEKEAVTDGGTNQQTMSDVDHQSPQGKDVKEMMERGVQEDDMATNGGVNSVPGTSFGDYSQESPKSENFMGDMPV